MDFTIKKYEELLDTLQAAKYSFQSFNEFLIKENKRSIVLRHDVDLVPENSLRFARIQSKKNIKGVYYFRSIPESWKEDIILEIHELGHEIGYHYETMDTAKGDIEAAWEYFKEDLVLLRKLVEVDTVCMHGSPRSKYDNKEIWSKFDYRTLNLIGEPYYDVDFNKVLYLTDTGRRWDGHKVSVRDKVQSVLSHDFQTTDDIISACNKNQLPDQIMMNFHPQRWHSEVYPYVNEYVIQNLKNVVKRYFYVK